jgi:hypothetical protein
MPASGNRARRAAIWRSAQRSRERQRRPKQFNGSTDLAKVLDGADRLGRYGRPMQGSHRPRPLGRPWLLAGLAVSLALPAACAAWLYALPVDPAPYLATIEGLPVPPSWEVIHTQTLRDPMMGSRVDRYYLVAAEPVAIAPVVQDVLRSAGLEIYDWVADSDWCDSRPIGATPAISCPRKEIPTCRENGPGGPVSCTVQAFHWLSMGSSLEASMLERLYVSVSARGDVFEVGVNDQRHRVEASNRALVVISADRTTARSFWSSPTPLASETRH